MARICLRPDAYKASVFLIEATLPDGRFSPPPALVARSIACYNSASFVIAAQERGVTHGLTQLLLI